MEKPENFSIYYQSFNKIGCCLYDKEIKVLKMQNKENVFDELCQHIFSDWIKIENTKVDGYVLGLRNLDERNIFQSNQARKSLEEILTNVFKEFFNDSFIHNYDKKLHNFLFNLTFKICENNCELVEKIIEEISKNE